MQKRVLVTGAGGAAAIAFLEGIGTTSHAIHMADISPFASGLYLVPENRAHLIPRGDDDDFERALFELCRRERIDVLVPTVDAELVKAAAMREDLLAIGTTVMIAPIASLIACLDKAVLARVLDEVVPVPTTVILSDRTDLDEVFYPCIAKPRRGSGGRGVQYVEDAARAARLATDGTLILQAFLPGREYSVDTLCDPDGRFVAAVPRERLRVDSGIAVTARTVCDPRLVTYARDAVASLGLTWVANVQFREDASGRPHLLEINPRFPGTMPLTVASGVNMPRACLDAALGIPMPSGPLPFRLCAMVRTWSSHVVDHERMQLMMESAPASRADLEVEMATC